MKITSLSLLLGGLFLASYSYSQTTAKDLVFNIQVTTSASAPSISLKWNKQPGISSYNILKKNRTEKTFTTLVSNVAENDTVFVDNNITIGNAYEYCVQGALNVNVSGYVYAGILLPEVHSAGEVLLLVDNTYQSSASNELEEYKLDLIKEGWKVSMMFVSRTEAVASVKQLVIDKYNMNPTGLKGVILLGHVPVPYSGKVAPDAHADHIGAWPSDMFYGNIDAIGVSNIWIDIALTSTTATDPRNNNIIGDGKFDASNKPTVSAVKLFVGRIDVYNMPAINSDDVFLFKQYLAKNHAYRAGIKKYRQEAIVDDNFGYFSGEAFAQNGWRNFSSLLGSSHIEEGDYMVNTKANSYIWSYGCGSGSYTSCAGIGNTNDFTSNEMQSVFTMLYGSYYGDWDNQNNFLRAPIASPSASLVSIWGGRPNWFLHTMAMGEPIGYSYINSVDNAGSYFPKGYYSNKIHQSMQGDPTLKMYMFNAPTSIITSSFDNNTKVKVQWNPSIEPGVVGYYIYRAANPNENFTLLNSSYVIGNEFIDISQGMNVPGIYMVKAVKLETSTTGTFYNLSPGGMSLENAIAVALPVTIATFNGYINNDKTNTLYWNVENEENVAGYFVERSINNQSFEPIGFVSATLNASKQNSYSLIDTDPALESTYRIKSSDIDGKVSYSDIVVLRRADIKVDVAVYPSPFSKYLNINYFSQLNSTLNIQLRDITGKIITSQQTSIHEGQNTLYISDLDRLRQGMYLLLITDTESNEQHMFKVMKE